MQETTTYLQISIEKFKQISYSCKEEVLHVEELSINWLEARAGNDYHLFDGDSSPHSHADHLDYIVDVWLDIYAYPTDLTRQEEDMVYEGRCERKVKVASVNGYLVLGNQAMDDGFSLLDVCDAHSGDLEYAASILLDTDIFDSADSFNFFYLYDLKLEPEVDEQFCVQILKWLPTLVFRFAHVRPSLTVYYPRELPYEKPQNKPREFFDLMVEQQSQKEIMAIMNRVFGDSPSEEFDAHSEEVSFHVPAEVIDFMHKDDDPAPYPEEAKDKHEFSVYAKAGFEEIADTRLLVRIYID